MVEFPGTFVIKQDFERVSEKDENHAEKVKHFSAFWKPSYVKDNQYFSLFLDCEPEDFDTEQKLFQSKTKKEEPSWTLSADIEAILLWKSGRKLIVREPHNFDNKKGVTFWGCTELITWDQLLSDFLVDDKLEVQFNITIHSMEGFDRNSSTRQKLKNFDESSMNELSDMSFVVEEEKFYVSKLFMATQSVVFKSMLIGNFVEATKKEVHLKDVSAAKFQILLEALYGCSNINDSTVLSLVHLADFFDIPSIREKAELFLMNSTAYPLRTKLELATRYNLKVLTESCLNQIKTIKEIHAVVAISDVEELNELVAKELLKKLLIATKTDGK